MEVTSSQPLMQCGGWGFMCATRCCALQHHKGWINSIRMENVIFSMFKYGGSHSKSIKCS